VCLEPFYPLNAKLFRNILGLRNCEVRHLIAEVQLFQPNFSLQYIALVFLALNSHIKPDEPTRGIESLCDKEVFPIRNSNKLTPTGYDGLVHGNGDVVEWFIADRAHFAKSFIGLIPLLAFDIDVALEMEALLKALGFKNRMLSQAARVVAVTEAPVELHLQYTKLLRSKTDFFIRYVFLLHAYHCQADYAYDISSDRHVVVNVSTSTDVILTPGLYQIPSPTEHR
jgi:hypothetical protein